MKHDILVNGLLHSLLVLFKSGLLNTAHRSCRSAESSVACDWVCIIQFPAACAVTHISLEIIIQVLLMRTLSESFLLQRRIIQSPSNVVMAAQIIQEYIFLRQAVDNIKLLTQ